MVLGSASWDVDVVLIYGYYVDTSCFEIPHFFCLSFVTAVLPDPPNVLLEVAV